jgi:aryl-alcohol dehydrogenase-like predicted oxidoreductase
MQAIADLRGWSPFCALQISYSLIERTVERELIPMAREMGMGVCPWSPLGGGVLTGKYAAPGSDGTREAMNRATGRLNDRNVAIAAEVVAVASEIGCTPAQVALAWTLVNPAVVSPVLGARTPSQLEDNLGALSVTLDSEHIARLHAASAVPLGFPHETLKGPFMTTAFGGVIVEERQ